jgi:hypothetical protein
VTSSVPKGPALKVAGGGVCSGPVAEGVGSGCRAAGTCVAGGSWALIGKLANGIQAIAAKPSKRFSRHLEKRLEIVTPHSQKQLS